VHHRTSLLTTFLFLGRTLPQADDADSALMGFSGGQGPPTAKLSNVAKMKHCLVEIGQFIAGAADHEAGLEAQTSSAREVAKKCMLGLTVAESATTAALAKVKALNKESELLKSRAANADATSAKSEERQMLLVATTAECERLKGRCADLGKAEDAVERYLTSIKTQATELEVLRDKLNAMTQEAESAASSFESAVAVRVQEAEQKEELKWTSKCAALEEEIKSIEPSYQQAIAQQKGRIRLLERELSASEQRQKAVSDAQLHELEREMSTANTKILELEENAGEAATLQVALDVSRGICAAVETKLIEADATTEALHTKVNAMESDLVQVIGSRQHSDQTHRALCTHLDSQTKRATATIANLLSTLGMPSTSKCIGVDGLSNVSFGKTSGERELPKVVNVVANGGNEANELKVGDVIVGINGELCHELPYEEISAQLACFGEYEMNVVVSDEGSVRCLLSLRAPSFQAPHTC
jgi:chromosome segregation ATPase